MREFAARLQDALGAAYQIERELPVGGLGRLYLATETSTGRQVSVQALPPDLAARVDQGRFRAAVDKVARLRHAGILPLVAAGTRDDIVYCVWPHPRGESLRYRLIRDGGLGSDETVQVLHDIADALSYGHEHGVYHGDLRPDNIYVENGRAFIAEFGIRSALNAALGTESVLDARADVHALAVAGQQMVATPTGVVNIAITRALSIDPTEQFASAAEFRNALGSPPSEMLVRKRWRIAVLAVVIAALALIVWQRTLTRGGLDSDLLAVAPFEILDPEHAVWREGLVTVLSANLDGAGPLRTVSPPVVIRQWSGRADAASALELGRKTGARLVLFGRVVRMGGDSMRLTAQVLDAENGATVAELQIRDPASRMDRLADSLTVQLLRQLARSRAIGAVRSASLGTSSLPALKAFLEGEQHYRRGEWDPAIDSYQRAIDLDSTFALALYRAGLVLGWQRTSGDTLSADYLKRAGVHNHRLPPRDSMLVVAESLTAALDEDPGHPLYWRFYRRLYATTAEAVRRYPRDPEVWYEYGDVRYHHSAFSSLSEMRDAFDRSITLDSAFAPAFIHPIELAAQLGDLPGARRYVERYLALQPADIYADAMHLTRRLLNPSAARSPVVQAILDTASIELLAATMYAFRGWADSMETFVRLTRAQMEGPAGRAAAPRDRASFARQFGLALAYHGHGDAAWEQVRPVPGAERTLATLAWMGAAPSESLAARFARSLRRDPFDEHALAVVGAPWFARQRDSVSLRELTRRADSTARATANTHLRLVAHHVAEAARAFTALAQGDTAAAIAGLSVLPDTSCEDRCALYTFELAQLLDARGQDDELEALVARDSPGFIHPADGFWELYRARVAARRGDGPVAAEHYRFVRDVWLHADARLRGFVREAQTYLARQGERD